MSREWPPMRSGWRNAKPLDVKEARARDQADDAMRARARVRQGVLLALAGIMLAGLLGKTAYWQTSWHTQLAAWADAQHAHQFTLATGRGSIFDATGRLLAVSITHDSVIADPDVIRDVNGVNMLDTTVANLALALNLPVTLVRGQLDVPGQYVKLRGADGATLLLSQEQSDAVMRLSQQNQLPGIALIPVVQRMYPAGSLAGQALGFLGGQNGTGQYGVEAEYEQLLAGTPGLLYTAVDAQGNPLATAQQRQTPAIPGANVTLTLDANVQYWVEQELAQTVAATHSDGGTVVVMDPRSGALIALASVPSFDPNRYGQAPLADFVNPAVSSVYDPGSVMKGITMAAGVDSGVIQPDTTYYDSGVFWAGGVGIHNWDGKAHGTMTMTQVLEYSLNTGAATVSAHVGGDRYDKYLAAFGLTSKTGVDLPSESSGWLEPAKTQGQRALRLAENAFGEGMAVTPLEMVAAYGALANGGVLMRPYIVASTTADGGGGATTTYGPYPVRRAVSADTAQTVTQMLVDSAYTETQMNLLPGYAVAAKTGTSTPDPAQPTITYASVIGYAPATDPRFVMLVKLDHPRTTIYGATAAAPLWRELAQQLFAYYQIPPDAGGQANTQG
ncbi:MAG: cell division protein FtsI [Peptidoglycan synthetase] [Ktedonobacterales bacterium]|nr:MAG: cell division protein FtsI [Peptidoglycan synthetase] [Ktedonobacterales bacterium]